MADNFNFVDQDNPVTVKFLGSGKEGGRITWDNLTVTRSGRELTIELTYGKHDRVDVYEQLPTDEDIVLMKNVEAGEGPCPFELPSPETSGYAVLFIFPPYPRQAVVFAHVASHDSTQSS